MKQFLQDMDDRLLRSFPFAWITGLHLFVPVLIALAAILWSMGWFHPLPIEDLARGDTNYFSTINLLIVLVSLLLLILFIVRQVRYNQTRVHGSLPYRNGTAYFMVYFLIIGAITALPFVANLGAYAREYARSSELRTHYNYPSSEWNDRSLFNYEEGLALPKEQTELSYSDEQEQVARRVHYKTGIFNVADGQFWKYYFMVALSIALMLYALCASQLRDFGWAMLISALFPVILGILVALEGLLFSFNDDFLDTYIGLMTLLLIVAAIFAFVRGAVRPGTSRSFLVMIFLFVPYFVYSYLGYVDADYALEHIGYILYGSAILSVPIFNQVFKWRYTVPM